MVARCGRLLVAGGRGRRCGRSRGLGARCGLCPDRRRGARSDIGSCGRRGAGRDVCSAWLRAGSRRGRGRRSASARAGCVAVAQHERGEDRCDHQDDCDDNPSAHSAAPRRCSSRPGRMRVSTVGVCSAICSGRVLDPRSGWCVLIGHLGGSISLGDSQRTLASSLRSQPGWRTAPPPMQSFTSRPRCPLPLVRHVCRSLRLLSIAKSLLLRVHRVELVRGMR